VDAILRRLTRAARDRALNGGNLLWLAVGMGTYFVRRARRRGGRVVTSLPLRGEERVVISLRQAPRRRSSD
jgi:hypothetical protein